MPADQVRIKLRCRECDAPVRTRIDPQRPPRRVKWRCPDCGHENRLSREKVFEEMDRWLDRHAGSGSRRRRSLPEDDTRGDDIFDRRRRPRRSALGDYDELSDIFPRRTSRGRSSGRERRLSRSRDDDDTLDSGRARRRRRRPPDDDSLDDVFSRSRHRRRQRFLEDDEDPAALGGRRDRAAPDTEANEYRVEDNLTRFVFPFTFDRGFYHRLERTLRAQKAHWVPIPGNVQRVENPMKENPNRFDAFTPQFNALFFPELDGFGRRHGMYFVYRFKGTEALNTQYGELVGSPMHRCSFEYAVPDDGRRRGRQRVEQIDFILHNIHLRAFDTGVGFVSIDVEVVWDTKPAVRTTDFVNFVNRFSTLVPPDVDDELGNVLFYEALVGPEGRHADRALDGSSVTVPNLLAEVFKSINPKPSQNPLEAVPGIRFVYLDRLIPFTWMSVERDKDSDHPWRRTNDVAESRLEEILLRFAHMGAWKERIPLAQRFEETYLREHVVHRDRYAIFGHSASAGFVVSSQDDEQLTSELMNRVQHYYYYLFLAALHERIALDNLSRALSTAGNLDTRLLRNRAVEGMRRYITSVLSECSFAQVTSRDDGAEIWRVWRRTLDLDTMRGDITVKAGEFHRQVADARRATIQTLAGWLGALALLFLVRFALAPAAAVESGVVITEDPGVAYMVANITAWCAAGIFGVLALLYLTLGNRSWKRFSSSLRRLLPI